MSVWPIRSPHDLRNVVTQQVGQAILVPGERQAEAYDAWNEFVESFQMLEPDRDEPDLTTALIEAADAPLARLRETGVQVVAVTGPGTLYDVPVTRTVFVFAPEPFWFWSDGSGPKIVHLLGARCDHGHRVFADDVSMVRGSFSQDALDEAFEGRVPWCPTCAVADVETL